MAKERRGPAQGVNRTSTALLALGIVAALAGLTFALQGMGILGPAASSMYENPAWVTDGSAIFVLGLVVVAAALVLARRRMA